MWGWHGFHIQHLVDTEIMTHNIQEITSETLPPTLADPVTSLKEYATKSDWRVNANENQGYSLACEVTRTKERGFHRPYNMGNVDIAQNNIQLDIGRGESLLLPQRENLTGGLKVAHKFSSSTEHPYDAFPWERRDIVIFDYVKQKASFSRENVEVPAHWAENAVRITASKYLFGTSLENPEYEDSLRHPFDRIANTYTIWGWKNGYFAELSDAKTFNWELKAMLIGQIWAPNSPVWFNIGHWEQYRWGRPDLRELYKGKGSKAFKAIRKGDELFVEEHDNPYIRPQASACFLTEIEDSMESILNHQIAEGRIFASGSGAGLNISSLRSSHEPIAGRGRSSGPISFDKGWDRMAGAIKSGGRSRRAARMVLLNSDHPDIFDWVGLKNTQEEIAKVILREHNTHVALKALAEKKRTSENPGEQVAAHFILALPLVTEKQYAGDMDGEIYGETVSNQNANHSVSLKGDFWKAYLADGNYETRWVTKPDHIHSTFRAKELLEAMANSVWHNAEPGSHNSDYINLWNPVKSLGRITTSNPCSEYFHLTNTSCNLSSGNVFRFLQEDGSLDLDKLSQMAFLAMLCADLNIEESGFPIEAIAKGTYLYRSTGVGLGNIGGLLMALGIPYDSDEGRYIAALLTSHLSANCWKASAAMGKAFGPYMKYEETKQDLHEVLRLHQACHKLLVAMPELNGNKEKTEATIQSLANSFKPLPVSDGLTGIHAMKGLVASFENKSEWDPAWIKVANGLVDSDPWAGLGDESLPLRNSFTTLFAPGGTISAPLGIYDEGTTSAEPDYTLFKYKVLSGGGSITMFNSLALRGLKTLGYSEFQVKEAALEVAGLNGLLISCNGDIQQAAAHITTPAPENQCGPVRLAFENSPRPAGETAAGLITQLASEKPTDLPYIVSNGKGHIEAIPWLSEHHKAVFDCASTTADGTRAIAPSGHIKMLGALQPFISGACSKTVNLPDTATEQDIIHCFEDSHKMGVKCIALYRNGSKGISVYSGNTPDSRRWKVDNIWTETVKSVETKIAEIVATASIPKRNKLPGRRWSQIIKFHIASASPMEGFLIVGIYPDGTCGEVFGRLGQGGSFGHGMFESFCKAFSVMLQWGVPFEKAISTFQNTAFDPAGFTQVFDPDSEDGKVDIRSCRSVVDLMMKMLEWMFPPELGHRIRSIESNPMVMDNATLTFEQQDDEANTSETKVDFRSAEQCPKCHALAYIQDGKCRKCRNCDFSAGGCG